MGPIDIRYHAISLAAMFLALGVGIIVGSSTNFFGITSILNRQNKVIERLESNYKEIRREVHDTRVELNDSKQYVSTLEGATIPKLLSGKLDGFQFGAVTIGGLPGENATEDSLISPLKSAGASAAFKLRVKPEKLTELADPDPGAFVAQFGKELLRGTAFGSKFTDQFMRDGSVVMGGFEQPVNGVVFILGDNIDLQLIRDIIIPLERLIAGNQGISIAVSYGGRNPYQQVFKESNFLFFQNADSLSGQVEIITYLEELNKQKLGTKKIGP